MYLCDTIKYIFFLQKSKEEKKKKKHKHEEQEEDLLGGQADASVAQSEEINEMVAPPTSTDPEVCPLKECRKSNSLILNCHLCFLFNFIISNN